MMSRQCWFLIGVFLVQGCYHAQPDHADLFLSHTSGQVRDLEPPGTPRAETDTPPKSGDASGKEDTPKTKPTDLMPMDKTPPDKDRKELLVPPGIPGSNLPEIKGPDVGQT